MVPREIVPSLVPKSGKRAFYASNTSLAALEKAFEKIFGVSKAPPCGIFSTSCNRAERHAAPRCVSHHASLGGRLLFTKAYIRAPFCFEILRSFSFEITKMDVP